MLVGFKAEASLPKDELLRRARQRMDEHRLDLIVANDLDDVSAGTTTAFLLRPDGPANRYEGSKKELAERILDEVR